MGRLTWLADELRKAGLRVTEVPGWQTRGSNDFHPEGMTWHATAGSRKATAQAEVNVILRGSATAPAPIAQLMLWRDGTIYVCAAGKCFHNKVGWDGPNKGLGNTHLLGMEMANDNNGEPWPAVQLDAARRATAAILKRLNADPMRRLAAHYEHQPYATRPRGEGSTKSDPHGVDMNKERPRVAALMHDNPMSRPEEELPVDQKDFDKLMTGWASSDAGKHAIGLAVGLSDTVPRLLPDGTFVDPTKDPNPRTPIANLLSYLHKDLWLVKGDLNKLKGAVTDLGRLLAALAAEDDLDEVTLAKAIAPLITASMPGGQPGSQAALVSALETALRSVFTNAGKG